MRAYTYKLIAMVASYRRLLFPITLCALLGVSGCGGAAQPSEAQGPAQRNSSGPDTRKKGDPSRRDPAKLKEALKAFQKAIDEAEGKVKFTMDCAVGKEAPMKTKKKTPAVELVTFLRSKKFPLGFGKGVHSRRETFMLDRENEMHAWNDAGGKGLSHDKRREVTDKVDELEMQLEEVHNTTEQTNHGLLDLNMAIMIVAGTLYSERHKAGYELDDMDYNAISELVSGQRRVETLSAMATGLEAAYRAVVGNNKDPKMIEAYVNEASKGFPTTATASTADGKAYIESLKKDTSGAKARYVQWTKDLHGEDDYGLYAKGIDEKFAKIDQLMATDMGSRTASNAPSNGGGGGAGGSGGGGAKSGSGSGGNAALQKGVNAAMKGDATGAALAAVDMLPIDGRAKTAIHGAALLAQGDLKGAAQAATSLVPDGPIKKGLSILTSFL